MAPKILRVVLEHTEEAGADVVRVFGVFTGDEQIPPPHEGVTRNVVQVFEGYTSGMVAFRIHPRSLESASKEVPKSSKAVPKKKRKARK